MKRVIFTTVIFLGLLQVNTVLFGAQNQTLHKVPEQPLAPDFTLNDVDGKEFRLKDLRGKTVLVNFWATWCPPCRFEMPSMERARIKLENTNVVILAIDVGEDADTVFTFTGDYPVNFPLLLDLDSKVIKQWPVIGLPTSFVVNPSGHIVYRAIGSREWDDPGILQKLKSVP